MIIKIDTQIEEEIDEVPQVIAVITHAIGKLLPCSRIKTVNTDYDEGKYLYITLELDNTNAFDVII
jgi:hypothetical protein